MNPEKVASLFLNKSKKKIDQESLDRFWNSVHDMPASWSRNQKAWHLLNQTLKKPKCKNCNNKCKFLSTNYWSWCSHKCMGSDTDVISKKKFTNKQRFGTENPQNLDAIKRKQENSLLKNYGVNNFSKSKEFLERSQRTSLKKYGTTNPSKNQDIINKIKQAKKYEDFQESKNKRKNTYLKKHGVTHNKYLHLNHDSIKKLNNINFLLNQNQHKSCQKIAEELGCSPTPILTKLHYYGHKPKNHTTSDIEKEITQYIKNFTNNIVNNDRNTISPKEIDILAPKNKFAIEVNGIFWHGESHGKHKNYHLNKTIECQKQDIDLWHIFDKEWIESKEILKSKISRLFGNHQKIYARNCTISQITKKKKKNFLNLYHLQKSSGSTVDLGLYHKDQLVSVMTFVKPRFSNQVSWEISRFATINYVTVVGGANKLFKHFVKKHNPDKVITYVDRRVGLGDFYKILGFKYSHSSDPNYFYFYKNTPDLLESRLKYQKHKLKEIFGSRIDLNKTESQIMREHNFDRIWDCGNKVYIWNKYEI